MKLLVYDIYLKDKKNEEAMVSLCLEMNTLRRYFDNIQDVYYFDQLPNNEYKKNIDNVAKEMLEEEFHQDLTNFIINRLERNMIKEELMEKERYKENAI